MNLSSKMYMDDVVQAAILVPVNHGPRILMTTTEPLATDNSGPEHEYFNPFHLGGCTDSPIGRVL